jgi:hypothetical protein
MIYKELLEESDVFLAAIQMRCRALWVHTS